MAKKIKKKELVNIHKCNSKLWREFSVEEKKQYNRTYKKILFELKVLSEIHNRSKAHNLACMAAWGELS